MRPILALLLSVSILVGQAGQVAAQCSQTINGKLRELGVEASRVKEITISRDTTQEGANRGYSAWVRLNDCRGSLVLDMTTSCLIINTYTRGSCRISGVRSY